MLVEVNNDRPRIVRLVVKHGALVQESREPLDGFTEIQVPNPETGEQVTKYIKRYSGVSGKIEKIEWYENEYQSKKFCGYRIIMLVEDESSPTGEARVSIDMPVTPKLSRVCNKFLKVAENINPEFPLELRVWVSKDDELAIVFSQEGAALKHKYTKENPGDCPQPTYDAVDGWDFRAVNKFLRNRVDTVVIPKFSRAEEVKEAVGTKSTLTEEDIPF